jgi:hypothetical protein
MRYPQHVPFTTFPITHINCLQCRLTIAMTRGLRERRREKERAERGARGPEEEGQGGGGPEEGQGQEGGGLAGVAAEALPGGEGGAIERLRLA